MKTLDLEQGSTEWMMARLGIPTASRFDRLLTPKTRKPSASRDSYRAELVAEYLMGQPLDWGTSAWMERGTELEDEARRWYEMDRGVDVEQVGLVLRDDGLVVFNRRLRRLQQVRRGLWVDALEFIQLISGQGQ